MALKYPGPPARRSPRAHHRRFPASPAQLRAKLSTTAPVPTMSPKTSTYRVKVGSGIPHG